MAYGLINKISTIIIILLLFIFLVSMIIPNDKYDEPEYTLIKKNGHIEIRDYKEYTIASTSINSNIKNSDSNMFRTLASYIFGENEIQKKIPMTAPVTTFDNGNENVMFFYMIGTDSKDDLPIPINKKIKLDKINLGRCAVITFSWLITDSKINRYKQKLIKFLDKNGYKPAGPIMINRYDSPWTLPFMRKNELLIQFR